MWEGWLRRGGKLEVGVGDFVMVLCVWQCV